MPLRDHFRPPLFDRRSWEGVHAQWPAMMITALDRRLPRRYIAEPRVHHGPSIEVDVGTFEFDESEDSRFNPGENGGGLATAVWAPPGPTLTVAVDFPAPDEYEVRFYDTHRARRLVAAVEIVSPSNQDRPEHRRAFVAKCAALLQDHVSLVIVDVVTDRGFNLYGELLGFLGLADPSLADDSPPISAVTCRWTVEAEAQQLQAWSYPLALGQPLPTLPLWLAENLAIPLELEPTYEETCRVLRIP